MINRPIGLDEIERAMTDNTPRPEPMSREQVLAVLENWMGNSNVERNKAIAAVAALYDERDALRRALIGVRELLLEIRGGTGPSDAEGGVMAGTNRTTSGAIGQP